MKPGATCEAEIWGKQAAWHKRPACCGGRSVTSTAWLKSLSMLGEIAVKSGEQEKAQDYYRQAQAIYDNLGNQHYVEELERVIEGLI